jgi:hypothetical protein
MKKDEWKAKMTRLMDRNCPIDDPISCLELLVTQPDGTCHSQQIQIGRPLFVDRVFLCQIRAAGPISVSTGAVAVCTFTALSWALGIIRAALHNAVTKDGYQVRMTADGKDMTLEHIDNTLFGDAHFKDYSRPPEVIEDL